MKSGRAVFLDRDGTINIERPDYVKSWEESQFLPGAFDALRRLSSLKVDIIVVTNQSAIGRQVISAEVASGINRQMVGEVKRQGGRVTAVYVCPHAPWWNCSCRKPKPGLLLQAAAEHHIDLSRSFLVGNQLSDAKAAVAAGCRPILVSTGRPTSEGMERQDNLAAVHDLYQAVLHIEMALNH
jgi:D-glycero-D-manno-heptose 1,7-bisphosphate phosphatase